ncbi:MAG: hypothetical protein LC746_04175 [Acidobacteria bacterium]|nr:hypothetical protein [Acidobacteriota bacterium]
MGSVERSPQANKTPSLHLRPGDYGRRTHNPRSSIGAASGLAGVAAIFVGAALCAISWLGGNNRVTALLGGIGVVTLLLALPLLAFGAHCFDCVDRDAKNASRDAAPRSGKG